MTCSRAVIELFTFLNLSVPPPSLSSSRFELSTVRYVIRLYRSRGEGKRGPPPRQNAHLQRKGVVGSCMCCSELDLLCIFVRK